MGGHARYEAVVVGVSAGGIHALKTLFSALPKNFALPIVVVQHLPAISDNTWITLLDNVSKVNIKEADEKELIENGTVYIAPSNYHLMIEKDHTLSLSIDEKVNYARPSIDVLFDSAADVYRGRLIGMILTGSSNDGARGLKKIKEAGGLAIVQDPSTAEASYMPAAAIAATQADYILPLEKIAILLVEKSMCGI